MEINEKGMYVCECGEEYDSLDHFMMLGNFVACEECYEDYAYYYDDEDDLGFVLPK